MPLFLARQNPFGVGRSGPVETAAAASRADLAGFVGGVAQHQDRTASRYTQAVNHLSGQIGGEAVTIADFTHLSDKINFSGIDADTRAAGLQHFVFDGAKGAGTEAVGHIGFHTEIVAGIEYTVLEANIRTVNGADNTIDFQLALQGHIVPTTADLIL